MRPMPLVKRYHYSMSGAAGTVEGNPFGLVNRPNNDRAPARQTIGNFIRGIDQSDDAPPRNSAATATSGFGLLRPCLLQKGLRHSKADLP